MGETDILKKWINESNYIVFFGGAGVSTESNIPDFRSTDGLYNQKYKYPPETILSHSFFMKYPEAFYEFYKEKIHANVCWGGNKRWEGTWNSKNYPITNFTSKDKQWPDKYHLWVMDWDKDFIRIYLDGELLNETDLTLTVNKGDNGAGQGGYQNPYSNDYEGFGQRMMLNLAIGGINGRPVDNTAFPLKYHIDYIRIYQSKK